MMFLARCRPRPRTRDRAIAQRNAVHLGDHVVVARDPAASCAARPACASGRPARRVRPPPRARRRACSAQTSLIIDAPASDRLAHDLRPCWYRSKSAHRKLANAPRSPASRGRAPRLFETARAPGRVDSPPMSMMSAPSSIMRGLRERRGESIERPPSENESGVTLRMPMTAAAWAIEIERSRCIRGIENHCGRDKGRTRRAGTRARESLCSLGRTADRRSLQAGRIGRRRPPGCRTRRPRPAATARRRRPVLGRTRLAAFHDVLDLRCCRWSRTSSAHRPSACSLSSLSLRMSLGALVVRSMILRTSSSMACAVSSDTCLCCVTEGPRNTSPSSSL